MPWGGGVVAAPRNVLGELDGMPVLGTAQQVRRMRVGEFAAWLRGQVSPKARRPSQERVDGAKSLWLDLCGTSRGRMALRGRI